MGQDHGSSPRLVQEHGTGLTMRQEHGSSLTFSKERGSCLILGQKHGSSLRMGQGHGPRPTLGQEYGSSMTLCQEHGLWHETGRGAWLLTIALATRSNLADNRTPNHSVVSSQSQSSPVHHESRMAPFLWMF